MLFAGRRSTIIGTTTTAARKVKFISATKEGNPFIGLCADKQNPPEILPIVQPATELIVKGIEIDGNAGVGYGGGQAKAIDHRIFIRLPEDQLEGRSWCRYKVGLPAKDSLATTTIPIDRFSQGNLALKHRWGGNRCIGGRG